MRKTLFLLWLLFPIMVAAYHFNFGPRQRAREQAHERLLQIQRMQREKEPDWLRIIEAYQQLAAELPRDEAPSVFHQVELAIGAARIEMLDLERAIEDLTRLLQETALVYGENGPITRGVREQLGKAHYYATWVLKSNGVPESEWRPYAERARQLFRYLAEMEDPGEFESYEDRVRKQFNSAFGTPTADAAEPAETRVR